MTAGGGSGSAALTLVFLAASALAGAGCTPGAPGVGAGEGAASAARATGDDGLAWQAAPPLPAPVTNNAVAAISTGAGVTVFSFLGLDSTRVWSGVTSAAYAWRVGDGTWRTVAPVPGAGRLAATAQAVGGRIYVLGGYTVAEDGGERSVPDVDVYDPASDTWSRGADIPLPTDDAVSGLWRDSLIFLVSGWHDTGNVADVQLYDPANDRWRAATPVPGPPVFGHSGAVVGDLILYVDGVGIRSGKPRFVLEAGAWAGDIDPADPTSIRWRRLGAHPGPPVYRGAGAAWNGRLFVAGGSDNPYNYNGVGYDGRLSEPLAQLLSFDPARGAWATLPGPPVASMDHRQMAVAGGYVFLVGGMEAGRKVSWRAWVARLAESRR